MDYLAFKIWIERPAFRRFQAKTTRQRPESRRLQHRLDVVLKPHPGFEIRVSPYTLPDRGWRASVSFNPSHHPVCTDPWAACPLHLVNEVIGDVWDNVTRVITPTVPLHLAEMARLDSPRNFRIPRPLQQTFLRAWSRHEVPRATARPLWHSPSGIPTNASTGTSSRGMVRPYDHALKHGSPEGTFRVEVEARAPWLSTYGGIDVVGDINPTTVETLFVNRFEYAGLHLPVVHHDAQLQRLYDLAVGPDPCLTIGQLPGLVGHQVLASHGYTLPQGHTTRSQRRKMIERVGLAHDETEPAQILCLDPHYDEPLVVAA